MKSRKFAVLACSVGALMLGCGETLVSLSADSSRQLAPVPACIYVLPERPRAPGAVVEFKELDYWRAVFQLPGTGAALPNNPITCTGIPLFEDPALAQGTLKRLPFTLEEGEVVYGAGGQRLRLAWLQSHQFADGSVGGALALVRALETHAEVYGVGVYRGSPERTQFRIERLGRDFVIVAEEEGCSGRAEGHPCSTRLAIEQLRSGKISNVLQLESERVAYAPNTEYGVGMLEYHGVTTPEFQRDGIRLLEEVTVKDEHGQQLRRAEHERLVNLSGAQATISEQALWERVYQPETSPNQ